MEILEMKTLAWIILGVFVLTFALLVGYAGLSAGDAFEVIISPLGEAARVVAGGG